MEVLDKLVSFLFSFSLISRAALRLSPDATDVMGV